MGSIKDVFKDSETLTLEQFEAKAKELGFKFADLSDGKYVSKSKYDDDLKAKDTEISTRDEQIETLNGTIATRDTDLENLKTQLAEAGQDAAKLAEVSEQLNGLQTKYDTDVKNYQTQMAEQAYEFAVKEYANTKKFTSQAAKRDFVQSMIAKKLQMEDGKILGRDDFAEKYATENEDAFVVEKDPEPAPAPEPAPSPEPTPAPVPTFVAPTPGPAPSSGDDGGFNFGFLGVRPKKE